MTNLETALNYAKRGWAVLPLHFPTDRGCSCGRADCASPAKHPFHKFAQNGANSATLNQQSISDWYGSVPTLNVGVACGLDSDLVVLDVDPKHGGKESLKALREKYGSDFTKTLTVITGSGGGHFYFRANGKTIKNSAGRLGSGLDVRGEGGYVVAPPSVHMSGGIYRFHDENAPLLEAPDWLMAESLTISSDGAQEVEGVIPQGMRHQSLVSLAGTLRRRGLNQDEILSTLLIINQTRCNPPMQEYELKLIAKSMMSYEVEDSFIVTATGADEEDRPKIRLVGDVLVDVVDYVQRVAAGEKDKTIIPTGFRPLDHLTAGVHRKEMCIIAARPAMGKTTLAWQMALNMARDGFVTAVFSVEMSADSLVLRHLATSSKVDLTRVRLGDIDDDELIAMMKQSADMSSLPLYIGDEGGLTPARMFETLRDIEDLDCIFVDYLQLMIPDGKSKRHDLGVGSISTALRRFAKDNNVAVVALAQLNRMVESRGDKRPMISDVRDSGQIEQDADMIWMVYRPEYYDIISVDIDGQAVDTEDLAEIIVAKQRNGETGSAYLKFSGGLFYDDFEVKKTESGTVPF